MTEMILVGDSYEKSCWKWSGRHSGTTDWSMGNHSGDPRGDPILLNIYQQFFKLVCTNGW